MLLEAFWWAEDLAYQVEQIANQVLQIEQGVIMLENWALSLKNLDFSVLPVVGGPLGSIMGVFEKAQHALFHAALIKEKFDELYSFDGELLPSTTYFSKAFDWNKTVHDAHRVAMFQQASLPTSLDAARVSLTKTLGLSEAAEGHLEAQQAGNQLLGIQIAQQNTTNALLGTMAHTQSVRDMQEASAQDQALKRLEYVLEGWTEWTKTGGLHELPTSLR
jgi:P-type conjugative transfer protein TrbJ